MSEFIKVDPKKKTYSFTYHRDIEFYVNDEVIEALKDWTLDEVGNYRFFLCFTSKTNTFKTPTNFLPRKVNGNMVIQFANMKATELDLSKDQTALKDVPKGIELKQGWPTSPRVWLDKLVWNDNPIDWLQIGLQIREKTEFDLPEVDSISLGKSGMKIFVQKAISDPTVVKKVLGPRCKIEGSIRE